jgi:GMP synthase (glutamine-hydrolysing)
MIDQILVIDFGSQYNQLIVRRIRELGLLSTLVHYKAFKIESYQNVKGIILSGGPHSVFEKDAPTITKEIYDLNIPILGICYGMQLIAHQFGGQIKTHDQHEFGKADMHITYNVPLTKTLSKVQTVWMSHKDQVIKLPKDFIQVAKTKSTKYVMMSHANKAIFGVQFHPEVVHSVEGFKLIKQFVQLTKANKNWNMENYLEQTKQEIIAKTKDEHVILGLSGGVDSSVVCKLLHDAIGHRLHAVFVDHGLLRKNEVETVKKAFIEQNDINLIIVDAKQQFLEALKGVIDPEQKRRIIGKTFIDVFNETAKKLKDVSFLAQGTLYSDVIESGTSTAQTIKSHHNVGGLPKDLNFKLIEPLRLLFKDEVRKLGKVLKLPKAIYNRQPFPGPGLAIRIIGEVTLEKLAVVRESDYIFHQELKKAKLYPWQSFTVLTPIQTVGVKGDMRSYDYVLALRAIDSIDGMTATPVDLPHNLLQKVATRIINEVPLVGRVVYDLTSKPPATIEWE